MKKFLIILGILTLLVIGVLFFTPIYNWFTKPFFKNTVDAKEWYHQVDCEKEYIPLGTESRGCFTVSKSCVEKVVQIYKVSSRRRPILIYAKYK